MKYFQSGADAETDRSELLIEWTNQHGCGVNEADNPNKLNCQILLQFMCCDEDRCDDRDVEGDVLRDGTNLQDLQYQEGPRWV